MYSDKCNIPNAIQGQANPYPGSNGELWKTWYDNIVYDGEAEENK